MNTMPSCSRRLEKVAFSLKNPYLWEWHEHLYRKEFRTGTLDEPPEPHFDGKRQLPCP
jgi:hypothetical protein